MLFNCVLKVRATNFYVRVKLEVPLSESWTEYEKYMQGAIFQFSMEPYFLIIRLHFPAV
jgi:hypothetical protein